jgi:hypothetical protein
MTEKSRGVHLATLAHEGRLWDAWLEFEDDAPKRDTYRARLRFSSAEAEQLYRTTVIIIEPTYEEAVHRARALDARQLEGLLRSVLPEAEE